MFIRGVLCGMGVVATLVTWLQMSRAIQTAPRLMPIPVDSDRTAVARQATTILAQIERESPWILKPSAKPSTNS